MKTFVEFNVNYYVRVKLTALGREIHKLDWERLMSPFPRGQEPYPYVPLKEDSEGWCEIQLWELMSHFGKHMHNGCNVPFETTIQIEKTWA